MSDRQRGAAHVPAVVFLMTLVLFFGALVFGYVVFEKNNKLEAEIATARTAKVEAENKLFFVRHYLDDITKEIGEAGEWTGRENFDYSNYGNPEPLQNVVLPSLVRARIRDFAQSAGVTTAQGLATFFGHVKAELDARQQRIASLEGERTRLQTNVAEVQSAVDTIKGERDTEVASLNRQITQKTEEYEAAIDQKNNLLATSNTQYNQIREQLTDERESFRQERNKLNGEINVREAQISAISDKIKMINPPQAADGMVLDASQVAGRAWINIGRRDMLPLGTRFRITGPDSDATKAYGSVSRIENDRAELRVTGLVDRFDPIVRGDEVHNDLYSPNIRRNIYLLGRFGHPYSKPMVRDILENLGNTVSDKLEPGVDLVLVGADSLNEDGSGFTPITETPEYQEVQRLGIETAPLHKVREFLKLGD